jgi:hypothetical protein
VNEPQAQPLNDGVTIDDSDHDLLEGSSILSYPEGGLSVARPAGDGKWEHLKWTIARRMELKTSGRRQVAFRDNNSLNLSRSNITVSNRRQDAKREQWWTGQSVSSTASINRAVAERHKR